MEIGAERSRNLVKLVRVEHNVFASQVGYLE